MKKSMQNLYYFFRILMILILASLTLSIFSQEILYGPEYPPPKESDISYTGTLNDGGIGITGGKTVTITNLTLANTTDVYFCMYDNGIKLSLDGGDYSSNETLIFSNSQSDLQQGILVWTGSTFIPISDGISITNRSLLSKFVVTISSNGSPVVLENPGLHGLSGEIGGLARFTGFNMVLTVKLEMFVSDNGGSSWVPHLEYYNNASTPSNEEKAYSSIEFGYYWINDPPELYLNNGAQVDEGSAVIIDNSMMRARDLESDFDQILFLLDPLGEGMMPTHGMLYLNGSLLDGGDSFTMFDIQNNRLSYEHDGSETILDTITFSIYDGDNKPGIIQGDSVFHFIVEITPVDDPPAVIINDAGTVKEDSILTITEDLLYTEDPESNAENITYTIDPGGNSSFPENGLLRLNDIPLGDGNTFTQADIANGKLTYHHNGTETVQDGFIFTVTDEFGHFAENNGSSDFFFEILINTTNDDPFLTKLNTLEVEEGGSAVVGNMNLAAADEESPPEDIRFTLDPNSELLEPNYGEVRLNNIALKDGESFTMDDVNSNRVTYVHDGSEGHSDFFLFNVTDPQGGLAHDGEFSLFHFNIAISNVNDPPYLANPIEDQTIRAGEEFNFTIPENTFDDVDEGDILSYEAHEVDNSQVPEWMSFNSSTRNFNGTPQVENVGTTNIVVIARDQQLEEIRDTFSLLIQEPIYIKDNSLKDLIEISPNPFQKLLIINYEESDLTIKNVLIINIMGEIMKVEPTFNVTSIEIGTNDIIPGLYFIQIDTNRGIITKKLIKE